MDEKALDDLYSESIRRGYRGSKEEFVQILYSDSAAFDDMFAYATYNGYNGSVDDFSELIGKKKSQQIPEWALTEETERAQRLERKKKEEQEQFSRQKAAPPATTASPLAESSSVLSSDDEDRSKILEMLGSQPKEPVGGVYMGSQKAAPVMKVEALPVSAPSKSEADFSSSLEEVNKDLMDYDEDYIVPKLEYLFGKNKYNFEFNWYRDAKEAIEVKAPNGKKTVIPVDAWTEKGDIESAEAFKKFLNENKPKLAKLSDEYNIYQSTIKNEQDMKKATESMNAETMQLNKIQQDLVLENTKLDKELKYLQSVPQSERGSQDYINRLEQFNKQREDFSARLGNASLMEKDVAMKQSQLYASIGRYTSMRAEQGGFFGGLYNSLLGGYSSMGAAATGIVTDVIMSLPLELTSSPKDIQDTFTMVASSKGIEVPTNMDYEKFKQWSQTLDEDTKSEINSEVKDYLTKRTKGEMLPSIRKGLTETIGAKGTTPEYIQDAGLIKGGIYGLAASLPAMSFAGAGPAGTMSAFFLQGYDATMKEMESDEFKDVSENEKYLVALPVGIVSAALEEFGMRNVLGKSGLVNDIVAKALSKSSAGTTATTFKQLVENEIESRIARGALVLTASGLSEAETGAAQAAAEIGIKELYNTVKGKDMFKTPETVGDFFKEVAIAGVQEAIGGVVMGSFNAVGTAYGENNFDGVTNETLDVFSKLANDDNARGAYAVDLKMKIVKGEITPEQGKKALDDLNNSISVFNSIPDGLAPAQQRQAFSLLRERKGLEAEIQGKDEAMVKKQKARIAEINSELEKVSEAKTEAETGQQAEVKPITYEQMSKEARDIVDNDIRYHQGWIDEYERDGNTEDAERHRKNLEVLKSDPVLYYQTIYVNDNALTKIKEEQDAIQVETAGQVPVQPTARPSEEVAQGEPQAEPQVTAQAGVEEEVSRLEQAFGGAFAETEQMLPASVDATVLEAVPTERKMELTFTQEDGTVSPLNGNEQMASDLYQEAVAIPKAQRTPAQQSVVDMVVSAQTQKPSGVSVSNKAQVAELETKTTDADKKKIIKAATTAINTLKSIFPDMDIVIHESNDSYTKQVGQSTRGNFEVTRTADGKIVGGRIDINLSKANMRTVAHEVAHAVMLKAFGDNPALFKVFRDRITKILSDTNVKKLNDFASQYEENDSHEEFLVELSAALTEAQKQLEPITVNKIAQLINKVVSKITGGRLQPFGEKIQTNELIDFMNTMSSAIGRGEAIQVKEGETKGAAGVVSKAQVEGIVPKTRAEVEAALSRGDRVIGSLEMDDEPMDINSMEMVDRVDLNTMLIIPTTTVSKAQIASEVKEMGETFTVSKAQVDAYHGSPYDFDRFTTEKMGTGEGVQAFGWGLYFSGLKSIAKNYADTLSARKTTSDRDEYYSEKEFDKYLSLLTKDEDIKKWAKSFTGKLIPRFNEIYYHILHKGADGKTFVDIVKNTYNNPKLMSLPNQQFENLMGIDKDNFIDFAKKFEGKLYQVSLHQGKTPDQYTWLEWDKPVSRNVDKTLYDYAIKTKDKELLDIIDAPNGAELYERLADREGSYKNASLFLLKAGIDGVKYPAESIARGATSDTARGFNYVVFDENAVTIVSKAQKADQEVRKVVKDARAQGYSEAAIKAFLLKKGFTEQEADTLMSKPEAGKKIELGEELMEGYDRMMAEVDAIIERGLNRNAKQETILANVLKSVENSDAYKNGTDIQREQIVRDVKQAFGEKMKSAPSVGKILGTIKDVKKVTMTEMSLLKKQLTDAAKGAKDLMKVWTKANKKLTAELKDMVRSGSINTKQLVAVLRKFQNTNLLNQDSIDSFISYMARVFADANYAERISNIRNNLKAAKRNIQTKIGVAESVQPLLQQMLSINPTSIPESVFDKYEALVEMLGQRKAVLELRDIEDVRADVTAVMDAVTAELSKVPDLAERFESYADKVVDEEGKVQYSETVDKMLEEDVIDASEAVLMRKYRSKIMPAAPKAKMTEAEIAQEKQDLIAAIKATKIEPSKLALRDEKESASQLSKLIDDDVLEKMDNKQLKTLLAVIGNINNGYMPHQAQIIKEVINAKKKQISRSVVNAKPLPLSRIYNKLKTLLPKIKNNDIYQMIVSNPLYNIDEVLGNFKAKDIFNALFNDVAKASATYDAAMTKIRNRLDEAYTAVSKSFGNDPAKVNRSSYRMMAYMLQLEHQTNPAGIQTKHSAMDYLEKTIAESEKGNTPYTDADIKMFREILDEMNSMKDADGNVDLDAFYSKFNEAEKNAIKVVQEINIETRDKAMYTSSVIRGDRITPLNNYVHHSLFPDNQPDERISNITTSQNVVAGMNPSTRGKSLIARTGVLSAMNFDMFAATQRGANFVMLDYYMTEPIRTAHRTLNETERALEEEYGGKVPKEKREVFNAIRQAFETAKDDYLTNKMVEDSFFAMVGQELARQGYRAMLASVPRFAAELASNMTFVITSDPLAMATGVGLTSVVMSSDAPSIMINLKSKNTNRVFSNDTLSGRMVDRGILNETTTKGTRGTKNGVINKIQQIHNNSTKKFKNSMELLADVLIATPDKMMIRPIWFGAFANEFERITGKKPDFDKIAANDEAYMSENKEALDEATAVADNKSTMAGATDNAFMGILKGNIRVTDDGYVKFFKMFNSFMSRFLIFEYSTARTAVHAAMGKGYLSKRQGASLLAAVALRMTLYTFIVGILSQEMINLFTPDEEEEEEKSLLKKAGQAMAQGFNALLLGRNFGNATKGLINYGVEWMNEKYLDFLREGEYDPYKDRLAYSYIPSEDKKGEKPSILDFFKNMMGPYTPIFNATELAYQKMREAQKRAAKEAEEAARPKEMFEKGKSIKEVEAEKVVEERKEKEMSIRIPLELLGAVGMIPLYRDVRKIILNDLYKDLKQAKVEAEKSKAQREVDKPPMGLTMSEYKRYFPDEYEARYGEGSEYYNRNKVEDAVIDAEKTARKRMLDAFFNYVPKQNTPKDIGKRPFDIKTKPVTTEKSSYVKKQKIGKRPLD